MNRRTVYVPRKEACPPVVWAMLAFSLVLIAAGVASAQLTTGTITGTVTDESGAVLPGVTVIIKNTDTGIERSLVTNARGRYEAPNLAVGPYEVTATLTGFNTSIRRGVTLRPGRFSTRRPSRAAAGTRAACTRFAVTVPGELTI